jgi:hypothetical protein
VTDPRQNEALEWAITAVRGQLSPVVLSRDELRAFVGTYGSSTVTIAGGRLEHQRNGTVCTLIPIGEDTFLFEGVYDERLRFVRDEAGHVTDVVTLTQEGVREIYPRER